MSLQQLAAQRMASQGRGPDTQLVHMSPREVAGLQALAMAQGGSLTINPETGLPEAGFLDKMLPMILGIGAMALTGGAAGAAMPGLFGMGMPATIGLGVGALQTARTGSLEKGLMAGLGAYGGAGLAGGLMAAGAGAGAGAGAAGAAGTAGAEVGSLGAAQAAPAFDPAGMVASPYYDTASLMSPVEVTGTSQAAKFIPSTPEGIADYPQVMAHQAAQQGDMGRLAALRETFGDRITGQYSYDMGGGARSFSLPTSAPMSEVVNLPPLPATITPPPVVEGLGMGEPGYTAADMQAYRGSLRPPAAVQPSMGQNLSQAGQGLRNLGTKPGLDAFMGKAASKGVEATGVGGGMGLLKYGAAAAAPMLMGETKTKMPEDDKERFNYAFDAGRTEEGYVDPVTGQRQYFKPTYTRYAAAGGPVEAMSAANVYDMQNARGGVSDMGIDNSTGMQRMAGGGISHLGDYSDGGRLLKGPGDGVSDSIPAMIGNRQPARLADGEFVVPARIVSELGNGSTEAGARKLYAMMDRVQRARGKTTGKNRVAANTRADKHLPA